MSARAGSPANHFTEAEYYYRPAAACEVKLEIHKDLQEKHPRVCRAGAFLTHLDPDPDLKQPLFAEGEQPDIHAITSQHKVLLFIKQKRIDMIADFLCRKR